jgi:predicted ArsR family transcriptional regulator
LKSRINILESLLTKEGYIVDWEENEDHFTLNALSCPYLKVGYDHPAICSLDHKIITEFFDEPVEIKSCIFKGDERCTFLIAKHNKETSNE